MVPQMPPAGQYVIKSAGPATEAPPVLEDTVALLTGGFNGGFLSSSEVFPSTSSGCSLPSLPAPRYRHTLFTTAEPNPTVAVCGGLDARGNHLSSCLVLDLANQRWEDNTMGPLPQPRYGHAVVTLNNIGNYLIGGTASNNRRSTVFLPKGSQQWVAGPAIPVSMSSPCAIAIRERSFLAIYGREIREYEVNKEQPTSEAGWQEATKWPRLQTSRQLWPGCSKINGKVVIAGGWNDNGGTLSSTEVLDIESRTIQYGEDLATPRRWFHIVTIRTQGVERALAMGGYDGSSSFLDSVEEFDSDTLTWNPAAANLLERRSSHAAAALPKDLIC